jgi:hypothetical protein
MILEKNKSTKKNHILLQPVAEIVLYTKKQMNDVG